MFISWPIAIFEVTLTCIIIQRLSPNVFLVPDGNEVNETPRGKPGGSDVWNCFTSRQETSTNAFGMTVRTKIAKCNTCSNEITCPRGNTSNLWGHLHKAHKELFNEHAPDNIKSTFAARKGTTPKNQPNIASALLNSTPYDSKSAEHKERTNAVLDYIASDGRPLCTVESPMFIRMLKAFDKRFNLPSRRTLTDTHIPAKYIAKRTSIQKLLDENKSTFLPMFSFTTDLWSSATLDPYMSLTVHYIDEAMTMKQHVLETKYLPERHTGLNLAEALEELLSLWNLDVNHVSCMTTDSAANMVVMARLANIVRLPCFGHLLHNGVQTALKGEETVIAKLKRVVAYFHQSYARTKRLRAEQKKCGLKEKTFHGPCPTWWGSCYEMVNDINTNIKAIKRAMVEDAADLVPTPDDEKVVRRIIE